jgi:hypothetical protein
MPGSRRVMNLGSRRTRPGVVHDGRFFNHLRHVYTVILTIPVSDRIVIGLIGTAALRYGQRIGLRLRRLGPLRRRDGGRSIVSAPTSTAGGGKNAGYQYRGQRESFNGSMVIRSTKCGFHVCPWRLGSNQ